MKTYTDCFTATFHIGEGDEVPSFMRIQGPLSGYCWYGAIPTGWIVLGDDTGERLENEFISTSH